MLAEHRCPRIINDPETASPIVIPLEILETHHG